MCIIRLCNKLRCGNLLFAKKTENSYIKVTVTTGNFTLTSNYTVPDIFRMCVPFNKTLNQII